MEFKIISLFSGAGGLDLGFRSAGFKTVVSVETDPSCCETLARNCPGLNIIQKPLEQVTTKEILDAGGLKPLEAALVIGGPPCQPFSLAGKRMGFNDPRGKLLLEFIRIVREALPVGFVMENVKGMVNWQHGEAIDAIKNEFNEPVTYKKKKYHYQVTSDVLDAVDFGVPQRRERIFFVGNRIGVKFVFPKPTHIDPSINNGQQLLFDDNNKLPYETVWNAIGMLPHPEEPSKMALRVSETIKGRIEKHGY